MWTEGVVALHFFRLQGLGTPPWTATPPPAPVPRQPSEDEPLSL